MAIEHSLEELESLDASAKRLNPLRSLVQWTRQNRQDIAANGWEDSSNPNGFDSHRAITTAGTSTAYTASFTPAFTSLQDGILLKVRFHTASGDNPTLNVDGLGAKSLVKPDGTAIAADEIRADAVLPVVCAETLDEFIVIGVAPEMPAAPTTQVFTSGGTWTRPPGCRATLVEVQGGGGGGGGGDQSNNDGAGGGGGGYARKLLDVSAIASSTIAVGSGGSGGAAGGGNGTAGGSSSWADGTNTITGSGGAAGNYDDAGGDGGGASGGDFHVPGANGGGSREGMGHGGGAYFGAGAVIAVNANFGPGSNGAGPGSGGSGARADGSGEGAGGDGGDGIVVVTEFY